MECPHCGADNPDGSQFCSLCFASFQSPSPRDNQCDPGTGYPDPGMGYSDPGMLTAPPDPVAWNQSLEPPPNLGMPASDVFASRGYAPLPQTAPAEKRYGIKGTITLILTVIVFAVSSIGGYFLVSRLFSTRTYSSSISSMTFKYPRGWKTIPSAQISSILGTDLSSIGFTDEIFLADSTSDDFKYILVALTAPAYPPGTDFDYLVETTKANFNSTSTPESYGGVSVTVDGFEDTSVSGKRAVKFNYTGSMGDITVKYSGFLIDNDGSAHYLVFGGRTTADPEKTLQSILDTVEFN